QEGPADGRSARDRQCRDRRRGERAAAARERDGAGRPGGPRPEPQDGPPRIAGVVHVHELARLLTRRRVVEASSAARREAPRPTLVLVPPGRRVAEGELWSVEGEAWS